MRGSAPTRWLAVGAATAAYLAVFFLLIHRTGASAGALVAFPVLSCAWGYGLRLGLIAAIVSFPLNTLLMNVSGFPGWDVVLRFNGGPGHLVLLVVAVAVGHLRDVRERLAAEMRERVRAEAELRERERRLEAVISSAPVILWAIDREGRCTLAEGKAIAALGFPSGTQFVGRRVLEIFGDQPEVPPLVERALRGEPFEASLRVRGRIYDAWYTPLRDASGAFIGGMGVSADVTERRKAEEALGRSERGFRELIERTPDAVMVHRGDDIVYANSAMRALLGYGEADDLSGRKVTEVVPPEDRAAAVENMARLAMSGAPSPPFEVRWLRKDGAIRTVEMTAVRVEFEGAPALVGISRDLTERRELQARAEASERLAALGRLASGVAHEINNPLAYVVGNLDLAWLQLERNGSAAGLRPMIRDAREGAERVRRIVMDLRSLARTEDAVKKSVDVRAALDAAIALTMHDIRRRALLVREYGDVPPVAALEARLGQVFVSLLSNAAQAIPEGEAERHEVRVATRTDPEGHAVIEVRDTGVGIPAEVRPRIFDPFFTTRPAGAGMGLGLSIAQSIVGELGGRIEVESEPGRGSLFRVVLPHAPERAEAAR